MTTQTSSLQHYDTAEDFLEKMESHLEANEVLYGLMLGITSRLRDEPGWYAGTPFLGIVEDDLGIAAAAVMTPPHGVMLYSQRQEVDHAFRQIGQALAENEQPVPSVIGESNLATRFAEIWSQQQGVPYHLQTAERVFELREVIHPQYASGEMRQVIEDDIPLAIRWMSDFYQDIHQDNQPANNSELQEQILNNVALRIQNKQLYFWIDGEPVSMAGSSRPTRRGVTINAVYTPPKLRGRGYASSCVAQLSQHLLDNGKEFCTLFTDLANPTSNKIYQQIGYQPVADFMLYQFGSTETA